MRRFIVRTLLVAFMAVLLVCGLTACGEQGPQGEKGDMGVGIVSIQKTDTEGNIDTYTITYSNDTKSYFTVENGVDGEQGIQGVQGLDGHTPIITVGENGNWYIDGVDSNQKAQGIQGEKGDTGATGLQGQKGDKGDKGDTGLQGQKGDTGLSAYELYIKYNPEYSKSEQEWLQDLAAGYLHTVEIELDTLGGEISRSSITTAFGTFASIEEPTKNGFDFVAWSLNGSIIDINTYVFFADCTLKAIWKEAENVEIRLNAEGGVVVSPTITIEYGKTYTLPTPSKEYQTFEGWYYLDTNIPQSGVWEYTHNDIELTAKWDKSNIYANLSVDVEYGTVETTQTTLAIGDYYTLPVPTSLKEKESFQGWYYGDERITNAKGESFDKCTWETTVTLTAAYYTEISTIYEFMDLAGKDLVGKYIITQDLDFQGLGLNSINSLSGTFDGGGHTLKNFVLVTKNGIISQVKSESIVCNFILQDCSCNAQGVGFVEKLYEQASIENITIKNCYNEIQMDSVLVGNIVSMDYSDETEIVNISIENSGNRAKSYCVYMINEYVGTVNVRNISICGGENTVTGSVGIAYFAYMEELNVYNLQLDVDIACGIVGNGSNDDKWDIFVYQSEITSNTTTAWSNVDGLHDSIHTGTTQAWGAKVSERCIDAGAEVGRYDLGEITSSIVLYPNANGIYTYYSATGVQATLDDVTLIDKNLFVSMLGFDESVWDLDNIDVQNGVYPTIRG